MDEDSLIVLAILALILFPILAIVSFVMVLVQRGRLARLEEQVRQLSLLRSPDVPASVPAGDSSPAEPPGAVRQDAVSEATVSEDIVSEDFAPEAARTGGEPMPDGEEPAFARDEPISASSPPTPRGRAAADRPGPGFEEKLGSRWAVWVGGVALALGGAFLVRYAVEEDLLGPGARILAGLAFSLGLIAAGEYLRRRQGLPLPGRAAYIPGVVTAAGTAALFATVYAAHALYGFLGPAETFVILGVVGVAAMFAAALHGPWLAGLGLVGAYATPLLVSSDEPDPWALASFVIVVTAAAFLLARMRLWRWLAVAATVAAIAYGFVLVDLAGDGDGPVIFFVMALAALVGAVLVYDVHRGRAYQRFDAVGLGAMAGLAALAVFFAQADMFSQASLATLLLVAAFTLAAALMFDALAPGAVIAGLAVLASLLLWPIAHQLAENPIQIIPNQLVMPILVPDALEAYLEIAVIPAAALFLATTASLMRRPRPVPPGFALALAGTATPIFALAVTYLRVAGFQFSLPFGGVAAGLALLFAATTERFLAVERRRGGGEASPGMGSALHATASCAAVALTVTFVIADSPLTLAFGLSALGAAWVSTLRPLPALRWCAAGFVLIVLARMGGAWMLAGEMLDSFPGWHDIALRYAVPAAAIYWGGRLLRRDSLDLPAAILDCGAILLGAAGAGLAIRLGVRGPAEALAPGLSLAEAGLYAALAFAASALLVQRASPTTSPVYRAAAPASALLALCLAVAGPLGLANPLVSGEDIAGGVLANTLLPGYALPGLLAGAAGMFWLWFGGRFAGVSPKARPEAPHPFAWLSGLAAFLLGFCYVTFEARKIVTGGQAADQAISSAQSYGYTLAWLLYGVALLALGIAARSRGIRLASATAIMLAVAKAFLFDMSELSGIWRALSFMGLGAALIGIGLVYQRLLFGSGRDRKA
ncbi:DUF2339 domain-containing protein [Labrys monachus]|uniref:Membrane protein n=1 Tax=Labrys monachus TaxID=217067 RepID=A0ABU0FAM8_9HYPH|nr:DUF2339 domain-containing protein [Labrys monachus]MDQ0391675.1 putative membrane protein [Labrys monachus]